MLIYAKQPVNYIIKNYPNKIKILYLAKEIEKKEYSRLMKMNFEVKRIPSDAAGKMCKNAMHQGILAEVDDYVPFDASSFLDKNFVLILSGLTDVGNIGAIVRTAYAMGVEGIIVSGIRNLNLEPILRTSTGALFDMPLAIEHNIHDVINNLKTSGFCVYGADMNGNDIRDVKVKQKRALVLGSEGEGLTSRIISKLDEVVSIKMSHEFDSLNVSVAGAILMDRMRI
ncbi:23S rRNA (guanosine(2251)-2'-O)-methyltransferase RlmB [Sulfurimonas sp.]|uniref:23S rRNA (guanosine(2251)-2'-O)-methyltransferase RlmB n=1 Tax=Sulfurimonas sp. TaxID=2022749 RepID=UPI002AB309F6|nr:23S rRNA (guanosine(2251)-2'-O)-methyltransferase RlmB [Sulfurimonas sp.]